MLPEKSAGFAAESLQAAKPAVRRLGGGAARIGQREASFMASVCADAIIGSSAVRTAVATASLTHFSKSPGSRGKIGLRTGFPPQARWAAMSMRFRKARAPSAVERSRSAMLIVSEAGGVVSAFAAPAAAPQITAPSERATASRAALFEDSFGEVVVSMWFLLHWMNQAWGRA